uniref:Uncharacterized protein n=1 Tax=Anguilla anguilla TaxID=7936 RepID=A0A0E9TYZ7_ANGAN
MYPGPWQKLRLSHQLAAPGALARSAHTRVILVCMGF